MDVTIPNAPDDRGSNIRKGNAYRPKRKKRQVNNFSWRFPRSSLSHLWSKPIRISNNIVFTQEHSTDQFSPERPGRGGARFGASPRVRQGQGGVGAGGRDRGSHRRLMGALQPQARGVTACDAECFRDHRRGVPCHLGVWQAVLALASTGDHPNCATGSPEHRPRGPA